MFVDNLPCAKCAKSIFLVFSCSWTILIENHRVQILALRNPSYIHKYLLPQIDVLLLVFRVLSSCMTFLEY